MVILILLNYFSSTASSGFGALDDMVSKILDDSHDQSLFGGFNQNGSISDSSHESRPNSDMFAYDR